MSRENVEVSTSSGALSGGSGPEAGLLRRPTGGRSRRPERPDDDVER
jgi:hypothetical protein